MIVMLVFIFVQLAHTSIMSSQDKSDVFLRPFGGAARTDTHRHWPTLFDELLTVSTQAYHTTLKGILHCPPPEGPSDDSHAGDTRPYLLPLKWKRKSCLSQNALGTLGARPVPGQCRESFSSVTGETGCTFNLSVLLRQTRSSEV